MSTDGVDTTVILGPAHAWAQALATRWRIDPPGRGTGIATVIRLALMVVAADPPTTPIPPTLWRLSDWHGAAVRRRLHLAPPDLAAARTVQAAYGLPSRAAAIRAALYLAYHGELRLALPHPNPSFEASQPPQEEHDEV
jgi:hypothetical protein